MNKYVIAHFNLHTGELRQEEVEAESKFAALKSYLEYPDDGEQTVFAIDEYCADSDQWVEILEVGSFLPRKNTSSGPSTIGMPIHLH